MEAQKIATMRDIFNEANRAGVIAVQNLNVRPMTVYGNGRAYFVEDGVCGFAWVGIRPASKGGRNDCEFVKWCKENDIGSYDDYDKAYHIWIHDYNQSMQKKEAHGEAFARTLRTYGIEAHMHSRMD